MRTTSGPSCSEASIREARPAGLRSRGWTTGGLVGLQVRPELAIAAGSGAAGRRQFFEALDQRVTAAGSASVGSLRQAMRDDDPRARTGWLVLLTFDALAPMLARSRPLDKREGPTAALPRAVAHRIDVAWSATSGRVVGAEGVEAPVVERWQRWVDDVLEAPERGADRESRERSVGGDPWRAAFDQASYTQAHLELQRHIELGDIYQANLCQQWSARRSQAPFDVYDDLRRRWPAPFGMLVEDPRFSLASISPERFVAIDRHGNAETVPIKGTRPRGSDPAADARQAAELLASEKDLAELLMIVDLERNDLGRLAEPGSVRVGKFPEHVAYPTVHHLQASVTAKLRRGWTPSALFDATFPGGSISGAPKRRALEIIASLESVDRGYFTGSAFWFGDDGSLDSSILIRTAQISDGHVTIGAGGGIVADSIAESEWAEAQLKAQALLDAWPSDPSDPSDASEGTARRRDTASSADAAIASDST